MQWFFLNANIYSSKRCTPWKLSLVTSRVKTKKKENLSWNIFDQPKYNTYLSPLTQCDVYFLCAWVVSRKAFGEESQTLGLKQESIRSRRQCECTRSLKAPTKSVVHSVMSQTTVAEWLGRRTPWSCWRYGEREVVSSIPGRGNIVGWVFHPTRWLARFSLIWI